MKRGEMQRHVWTEVFHHPPAQRLDFGRLVVLARKQQRRDLEPDFALVLEEFERLEHANEPARAKVAVEALGKTFEIDVGRIHMPEKFNPRLCRDVAGTHRYGSDAER